MRGSRAAAPKGTKSCRTQGDFRSSFLKGLKGLIQSQRANLRLARAERSDLKPERPDLRSERPERPDLRSERPEKPD